MKKHLLILIGMIFCLPIFAAKPVDQIIKKNEIGLLFIQQADFGIITPVRNKKGYYQLTLSSLRNDVVYFSNEPVRLSGKISQERFVNDWLKTYKKPNEMPNVALAATTYQNGSPTDINNVFVLSDPSYNKKTNLFTYLAYPLNGKMIGPTMLINVTLFVDTFHGWPP